MENRKKSSVLYITIALAAFGAGWWVCSTTSDSSRQTMELTFPGGSGLKIDTTAPQITHGKLLDDIFAQQFSRDGLMGWLADKDIFSFGDVRLVEALNNRLCGSIPGQPLYQKIRGIPELRQFTRGGRSSAAGEPEACSVSLRWCFPYRLGFPHVNTNRSSGGPVSVRTRNSAAKELN